MLHATGSARRRNQTGDESATGDCAPHEEVDGDQHHERQQKRKVILRDHQVAAWSPAARASAGLPDFRRCLLDRQLGAFPAQAGSGANQRIHGQC